MKKIFNTFVPLLFYILLFAFFPFGLFMRAIIGGAVYAFIEVMYDNTTDRWMALVGSVAFVFCGMYDEWLNLPQPILWLMIAVTILIMEYFAGLAVNKDFNIWDYRKTGITIKGKWIPLNLHGQICLPFFFIWVFPIAPFLIWLDNILKIIFV